MPETPTDEELGLDSDQMEALDPHIRQELRESRAAKRGRTVAENEAADLRKQLAFTKAGIPDTPVGQMFAKAYDGPTDDAAAIKAAFEEIAPPPPPVNEADQADQQAREQQERDDLAAQQRIQRIGASGDTGDGSLRLEDAMSTAKNKDEVMEYVASAPPGATDGEGRQIIVPRVE